MIEHPEAVAGSHRLRGFQIDRRDIHDACTAGHGHRPSRSECGDENDREVVHPEPDYGERQPSDTRDGLQRYNQKADRIIQYAVSCKQESKHRSENNRNDKRS
ncbi:MAG: hypothetical protein K0S39_5812 [Paenibacillus sp.]|nr:hypothetical protein [Paenibacillus sp.]